ncbi:MAG: T9SS type A sorting domain-containing protein [Hymenobacter sp.]
MAANAPSTGRFSLLFGAATALATAPSAALSQTLATLYPNPTEAGEVTLAVTGLPADVRSVEATLVNALGQVMGRYTLAAAQGAARTGLPTTGLAGGVYLVRLRAQNAQGQPVGTLAAQRLSLR